MAKSNFESLRVYQLSEKLADQIWSIVLTWNVLARDTVGKQLIRAADSVGANIAEGTGRGTFVDNRRFVRIARGSLNETQHWLRRAYKRRLLSSKQISTVKPLVDVVSVTGLLEQYRLNSRRLNLNATSSVVSPNVVLKLQPYITITGTTYNPDPAAGGVGNTFTNNGGGVYSLLLNGVPEPACGNVNGNLAPCPTKSLDVKSNLTGDVQFALTDIRQ